MNNDPHQTPDDPCALDLGGDDSPRQQADARVVHGLLRLLDERETARVAARVDRATAAIRAGERGLRLVGTRPHTFRERLAWIGGSAGMAAAITLALLFFPSSTEATAVAALNSMRSAARAGGRCYEILIQPHRPPMVGADRGRSQGADRLRTEGADRWRPEGGDGMRAERPDRARAEGLRRVGELQLGPEGCWTLTILKPRRDPPDRPPSGDRPILERVVMGFDGHEYWLVGPSGAVRHSDSQRTLGPAFPGLIEAGLLDPPNAQTDDRDSAIAASPETLEYLTLTSVLDSLDRGYTVSFDAKSDVENLYGRPITVVQARRVDPRSGPAPLSVRLVADAATLEVLSVRLTWDSEPQKSPTSDGRSPRGPQQPRTAVIRQMPKIACQEYDLSWFTADFHAKNAEDLIRRPR